MNIPIISGFIKFGIAMATFSEKIEKMDKRTNEIEKNYLNQFKEVRKDIADSELRVVKRIDDAHIAILKGLTKMR